MTREEINSIAKVVVIPHTVDCDIVDYNEFLENKEYIKLEDVNTSDLYFYDEKNKHHLTTNWHYKNTVIACDKLLKFGYNPYDFNLIEDGDFSFVMPKIKQVYEVIHPELTIYDDSGTKMYDLKIKSDVISSNEITSCSDLPSTERPWITKYHNLFKYPHECAIIENKTNTVNSNRTLLVSCDSHGIPNIPILLYYFKKVIVLDNRFPGARITDHLGVFDEEVTDVLFLVLVDETVSKYTDLNLQ